MADEMREAKQEVLLGIALVIFGLIIAPLLGAMLEGSIIAFVLYSPLVKIAIIAGGVGLLVKGTQTKKRLKKTEGQNNESLPSKT